MQTKMIVDTNIFIDFLKGNEDAVHFIQKNQPVSTSVVVVSELYSGVKTKAEMNELGSFLSFVNKIDVTEAIARKAGLLRRKYHKSHGIKIPDAIIAATAEQQGVPIATLDKKHFSVLTNNLIIPY
ncbi:MAG: type II toxin-antitoxin system VapC family toxin [Gracilimonas sp.]|uniref:type II toxin-antitoxin system VapC family toxin n=1 Tax=Gracilimonas sp. TaxID=1974203 RepID=UPI001B05169B|nr:type II toxin-antitoxin system VapC family toxin [Gracilimonas sp.]MBO6585087.1 type II toxin-antitoxin system VapC family toxin [Gracilimonas sp.]MBO6615642.1 type II toxin-antitoxin system VapC family toxin [Gracilimonas sp.]